MSPNTPPSDGRSLDLTTQNIARLQQLFPDVVSEGKIDFDRLRALLGAADALAATGPDHYELRWAGKANARREVQRPTTATLLPDPARSVEWDRTENVFIEGENLEVLRVLQRGYFGKVKMIYIDPPYNTGSDAFVYPDDYGERREDYEKSIGQRDENGFLNKQDLWKVNTPENGQYHSAWLSMMWPRLYLGRNLLREDGIIMISIDDNEVHNLRLLLNEIFGEENFVAELVWTQGRKSLAAHVAVNHEYVLIYCKNKEISAALNKTAADEHKLWREKKTGLEAIYAEYARLKAGFRSDTPANWRSIQEGLQTFYKSLPDTHLSAAHKHYNQIDEHGIYFAGDIAQGTGNGGRFVIPHPVTKKPCKVPSGGWRFAEKKLPDLLREGRIAFGPDDTTVPKLKRYLHETEYEVAQSVFYKDGRGASARLTSLFGAAVFDFPKDEQVIARLIKFVCPAPQAGELVLDFFAGSGTTAQAVMELNEQDGGNRRFLLVQLPEPFADTTAAYQLGYRTIADVTQARLQKIGTKLRTISAGQLPLHNKKQSDTGFRAYRLDYSNFRAWRPDVQLAPDMLAQLELFQEPLRNYEAGSAAMLTELLLKMAGGPDMLPLSAAVARRELAGLEVHSVAEGLVWLALSGLNPEIVAAAVLEQPQRLVVPGRFFGGDNPDEQVSNARLQLADAGVTLQLI